MASLCSSGLCFFSHKMLTSFYSLGSPKLNPMRILHFLSHCCTIRIIPLISLQFWIYMESFRVAELFCHFLPSSQLPKLTQPWLTKIQLSCISCKKKNQPNPHVATEMRMIFLRRVPGQNNDICWVLVNSEALTKCFSLGNWDANRWEMNFTFLFLSHRSGNTTLTEAHAAASVLLIKAKAPKGLLEAHNGFVIILFITLRQLVGTGVFLMSLEEMIRRIITSSLRSQERERGVCRYWDNCAFMEWYSPQKQVNISGEHEEHRVFWIKYRSWGCQVVFDS